MISVIFPFNQSNWFDINIINHIKLKKNHEKSISFIIPSTSPLSYLALGSIVLPRCYWQLVLQLVSSMMKTLNLCCLLLHHSLPCDIPGIKLETRTLLRQWTCGTGIHFQDPFLWRANEQFLTFSLLICLPSYLPQVDTQSAREHDNQY